MAERRAWDLLPNRRMFGYKFRRQHVIAGFIVDFYCAELKLVLVLELDGAGHKEVTQSAYDLARTARLSAQGPRVVRVRNEAVSAGALGMLLQELTRRPPSPQRGEG
jgi:5-methyltetrahydrofolate--homocysteine methyltransferase